MGYNWQELTMKNILTMAVFVGMTTIAIMLTAFTSPTKVESVLEVTVSPVWEGTAFANRANGIYEKMFRYSNYYKIRVYPTDNSCNAYYAVIIDNGREGNVHYTVKSNPDYNYRSSDSENVAFYSHYITIDSRNYYFKM